MVTPQDILRLADELAARDDEAAIRCAVSCAYYAAFLAACAWFEASGRTIRGRGGDHGAVRETLARIVLRQLGDAASSA